MSYVFNPYERQSYGAAGIQNKRKSQEYSRPKQIYGENEPKTTQPKIQFKSQQKQQPINQFSRTFHPGQQQPRVFTQQNALLSRYQNFNQQPLRPVSQQQSKFQQKPPFQVEQEKINWKEIDDYVSDESENDNQIDEDDDYFQMQFHQIKKQPYLPPQQITNKTNLDNLSNQSLSGESKRNSFNNSKKSSNENLQNNRSVFQKRDDNNQDSDVLMVVRRNTAAVNRPMTSEGVRRKKLGNVQNSGKNEETKTEQNDEKQKKPIETMKNREPSSEYIQDIHIYDNTDIFNAFAINQKNLDCQRVEFSLSSFLRIHECNKGGNQTSYRKRLLLMILLQSIIRPRICKSNRTLRKYGCHSRHLWDRIFQDYLPITSTLVHTEFYNLIMFILILFGYKQYKIFTLECLTSTLIDCVWQQCSKEIGKVIPLKKYLWLANQLLQVKEDQHIKEMANIKTRGTASEKRILELEKQLKEEDASFDPTKKDDKKGGKAAPAKKGGKDVPANPLEAERQDLLKDVEKGKESTLKYEEKLAKLRAYREKLRVLVESYSDGALVVELLDKTGERKFIKTKLDQMANTYLADKNTYILGYLQPPLQPDEEEQILALECEGFCLRTVDEDVGAVDEPLLQPQVKKDDKNKKKKK